MKSKLLVVAVLGLMSMPVFATGASDNCNGNGSCATGSTTTNQGGNASSTSSASGVGVGIGGNSSVNVYNKTENANLQGQQQSTNNANNSSNSSNVNVGGDVYEAKRNPVNTAYAPSIAPTANCALSVSGGISAAVFSASFGKAYIDENCAALERVRTVSQVLNDKDTAEALMCLDEKYKKARLNAGRACPVGQE